MPRESKNPRYRQLHTAQFAIKDEYYVTIGAQKFRWCRYWQEILVDADVLNFLAHFCTSFRAIGLNQVRFSYSIKRNPNRSIQ